MVSVTPKGRSAFVLFCSVDEELLWKTRGRDAVAEVEGRRFAKDSRGLERKGALSFLKVSSSSKHLRSPLLSFRQNEASVLPTNVDPHIAQGKEVDALHHISIQCFCCPDCYRKCPHCKWVLLLLPPFLLPCHKNSGWAFAGNTEGFDFFFFGSKNNAQAFVGIVALLDILGRQTQVLLHLEKQNPGFCF